MPSDTPTGHQLTIMYVHSSHPYLHHYTRADETQSLQRLLFLEADINAMFNVFIFV